MGISLADHSWTFEIMCQAVDVSTDVIFHCVHWIIRLSIFVCTIQTAEDK